MIIYAILMLLIIIIILLIFLLVYSQKLHYDEIKGLYSKIGIDIETKEEQYKPSGIKNHIKHKMNELEKQGGE